MEKITIFKSKLKTVKSNFSKGLNQAQGKLDIFEKNRETAPIARKKRLAEEFLEDFKTVKEKLKQVRQMGDALIEEINEKGDTVEKGDDLIIQIEGELDSYDSKLDEFKVKNDAIMLEMEQLLSTEEAQTIKVKEDKSAWRSFKPQAALKPSFLEKDSNHLETKHFTQLFKSYCLDGYQGSPPNNAIHIHLQPLIEATWWMSLVQRGITDNKNLDAVIEIILQESDARNPLHSRRMELLRAKKSGTHSDFLYCLEQQADLIEMKTLTQEALVSHLFLEQSDQEMAKICQDILSKNPTQNPSKTRSSNENSHSSQPTAGRRIAAMPVNARALRFAVADVVCEPAGVRRPREDRGVALGNDGLAVVGLRGGAPRQLRRRPQEGDEAPQQCHMPRHRRPQLHQRAGSLGTRGDPVPVWPRGTALPHPRPTREPREGKRQRLGACCRTPQPTTRRLLPHATLPPRCATACMIDLPELAPKSGTAPTCRT